MIHFKAFGRLSARLCGGVSMMALAAAMQTSVQAPALAQDAGIGRNVLDEITVTAQRRAESIQDVPMSVFALGADDLKGRNIDETGDLAFVIPNLQANGGGQNGQRVTIRGIGSNVVGAGTDSNVASYRDGIYLARQYSAEVPFLDVDRIEVLRGPQGTLYGRNATGGAISVISNAPEFENSVSGQLRIASYEDISANVTGNFAFGETVAIRGSVAARQSESFMDNLTQPDFDADNDYWQAKVAGLFEFSDAASLTIRADHIDADNLNFVPLRMFEIAAFNVYGLVDFDVFTPGVQPIPLPSLPTGDFEYETDSLFEPFKRHEETGVSAQLDWDFGPATLTAVTGYRDLDTGFLIDTTGNESTFGVAPGEHESEQYSFETYIASNTEGRFGWLVGGYYFTEEASTINGTTDPNFGFRTDLYPNLGFVLVYREGSIESEAFAGYADFSYDLTETLTLTASGRYSWEEKSAVVTAEVDTTIFGGLATTSQPAESWSNFSPRVGLEFRPDEGTLLYASVSTGFKSGGFNTAQLQDPFDEETVTSYEIGLRKSWAGGTVVTNAAAFWMEYEDLQIQQRFASGNTFISQINNAANSTITGLEAELAWAVSDGLELSAALGLLDTEFDDFITNLPGDLPGTPPTDLSGNSLPNAPDFTGNLTAIYTAPETRIGIPELRVDYRYQSSVYFDALNTENLEQEGYGLVNARISLSAPDDVWEFAIAAENLLDEEFRTSGLNVDAFGAVATYGRARVISASLNFQF